MGSFNSGLAQRYSAQKNVTTYYKTVLLQEPPVTRTVSEHGYETGPLKNALVDPKCSAKYAPEISPDDEKIKYDFFKVTENGERYPRGQKTRIIPQAALPEKILEIFLGTDELSWEAFGKPFLFNAAEGQ
ncbi:MAG: hypothetical protein V1820_00275 [archaeon]